MATVRIDGITLEGDPIFIVGIYEMATHLIVEMFEHGSHRCTLPIIHKGDPSTVATLIHLHRGSTVALSIHDDGSDVAAAVLAKADADMSALMVDLKASADAFDGG